ncbi:B12-binding domain-containing radical SAM protein [Candidatus Woesearchaeota archaeon]|nr:B12-binding domain-containing radical SAM protein [Candidatus Woesearchaeota archaeon]|tara:strand:- start:13125 stop:14558 length:1434 start_codon:yes stop_codon:yes gene_type:complete
MKVLLINPPMEDMIMSDSPMFLDEERGYNPPLGLLYLSSYAIEHSKHHIEILDSQVEEMDYKDIGNKIEDFMPDIVGIQAMTFTLMDVIKTAEIVKKINPGIKVILGGPHANIFPYETINLSCVDYVILGEGEHAFTDLLNNIGSLDNTSSQDKLREIKGIVFKDSNGNAVNTGARDFIENLDMLPFPARKLTPHQKYTSLLAKRSPVTTMITSRGCPYKCTYCDRPHLGKMFRARSAKNVVDEMEECVGMGIKEFLIYDDTFTIDRQRVIDICDEICRRKLDIGWDIRARVNTVDKEMLLKLRKAGCERIHYGVEASDQKVLDNLGKGITLKQVKDAFRWTKQAKIETLAYFMIGSPGEGREEILKTIDFAKQLKPDFVSFSVTTPFPETELYKMALEKGIIKTDVWKEFAENPSKDFRAPLWTENLTRDELMELLMYAYKNFYTRPGYIIKKLMNVRSIPELKRKVKAGLRMFRL